MVVGSKVLNLKTGEIFLAKTVEHCEYQCEGHKYYCKMAKECPGKVNNVCWGRKSGIIIAEAQDNLQNQIELEILKLKGGEIDNEQKDV